MDRTEDIKARLARFSQVHDGARGKRSFGWGKKGMKPSRPAHPRPNWKPRKPLPIGATVQVIPCKRTGSTHVYLGCFGTVLSSKGEDYRVRFEFPGETVEKMLSASELEKID